MKTTAALAFLLSCSALALAQQTHTYIYEYDANSTPASTYKANIDGVTIPVPQNTVDLCMGCTYPPTGSYSWMSANSDYSTWAALHCGSTLRGVGTLCTVNINFKSVTNGKSNSWAPSYIFRQDWANYAAQQNAWTAFHLYPLGFTITCGVPGGMCVGHYYQMVAVMGAPAGGVCQSSGPLNPGNWSLTQGTTTDGTCNWKDIVINGVNEAPPQDVVFGSDYPGSLPSWTNTTTYSPNAVIVDGLGDGHYFQEETSGCPHSVSTSCTSLNTGAPTWNTSGGLTCNDHNCTWQDLGPIATLNANTNLASPVIDTEGYLATGMPAVWETPFFYSQKLFYAAALTNFESGTQIKYLRTGIGVGEEASITEAQVFESLLPFGTMTDAQLKGAWTNEALQVYANNAATMASLSPQPTWVLMALVNCGTSLSTSPGTDCTWADVEAAGALSYAPYYGGYGTQGLQSSDLYLQQGIAQCKIPFQGKSCCSDNWCETRYYMLGKLPYVELQESCSSYYASGTSATCIYDPNNPNASLSEVLALATQHGTNVIELGVPEFDCAYGSPSSCASYTGAASATATAIQTAATGQPSYTGALPGTGSFLVGLGNIF